MNMNEYLSGNGKMLTGLEINGGGVRMPRKFDFRPMKLSSRGHTCPTTFSLFSTSRSTTMKCLNKLSKNYFQVFIIVHQTLGPRLCSNSGPRTQS